MGLFNRLFKKGGADALTGSIGDLAGVISSMTVGEIKQAVIAGQFDAADVVAAESGPQGKKRKGVLALG
jgi:hypothetical protein